jgi:hypothetical protein
MNSISSADNTSQVIDRLNADRRATNGQLWVAGERLPSGKGYQSAGADGREAISNDDCST